MKKLEKETVLKERILLISAVSFFIFILPYLLSVAINGIRPVKEDAFAQSDQTIHIDIGGRKESILLDVYLLGALARHSSTDFEDESLKAIAILLRGNAVCIIDEDRCAARESFYTQEELRLLWGDEYEANVARYRDVITSTQGIVIFYEGDIVEVPYHWLSCGQTRDNDVYMTDVRYLSSVDCSEDMYADGYYTTMEINMDGPGEDFAVLLQDRFGYVLSVRVKGEEMNGELFRMKFGLPSACFDVEKKEETYVFHVRGKGHGFGLSLYGANALAVKGYDFAEILQYFFPGIEIRKENRSDIEA